MTIGCFMGMVGALIRNANTGRYLLLRRSDDKDVGAGQWECLTGRVDQGEGFPQALQREVMEELGIRVRPDFILRTSHFYRGEKLPENEMIGVIYACSMENPEEIQLSWEHSEYRWMNVEQAIALLSKNHWLIRLIQHDQKIRSTIPEELFSIYRTFES
jgi:8-oxo-dGTP diphosphatase